MPTSVEQVLELCISPSSRELPGAVSSNFGFSSLPVSTSCFSYFTYVTWYRDSNKTHTCNRTFQICCGWLVYDGPGPGGAEHLWVGFRVKIAVCDLTPSFVISARPSCQQVANKLRTCRPFLRTSFSPRMTRSTCLSHGTMSRMCCMTNGPAGTARHGGCITYSVHV